MASSYSLKATHIARGIALAALCIAASGAAARSYKDGNALLRELKEIPAGTLPAGGAIGYIMAIADYAEFDREVLGQASRLCIHIPERVTAMQLADITRLWLEKNPQLRHYGAPGLVTAALKEAYPCKR